jgi:hypothetical protein
MYPQELQFTDHFQEVRMPKALPSQIRKNYRHLSEVLSLQIKQEQLEKLRKKRGGRG